MVEGAGIHAAMTMFQTRQLALIVTLMLGGTMD